MPTGEQPAQDSSKPVSHSSTITLALAIVALGAAATAAYGAGKALTRLDAVELAQTKAQEFAAEAERSQQRIDRAQDLAIAGQGKDLEVIRDTVQAINRRMERWEERGFVTPARGGGR